jgi:hypothetical protein
MRLNEKQKLLAVVGVFVAVLIAVGVLNYLKFKDRSQLLAEIERYQEQENQAHEKIKRIPDLLEKRARLIENIETYAEILPAESDVQQDTFVNIIDGYRKDTNIVIQRAEYVRVKQEDSSKLQQSFVRHRYRFKLFGTVPDFLNFVNKVENHTRFLKVDAIKIKPLGTNDGFDDELRADDDEKELSLAENGVKEIELTVSTYTYVKGTQRKQPS